jgi:rhodanese-related sulfurtransferase
MSTRHLLSILTLTTAVILWVFTPTAVASDDVPRMSTQELKELLGSGDVIILDVRTSRDMENSTSTIKGAIREDPQAFDTWADTYPKDKTLVLFCA